MPATAGYSLTVTEEAQALPIAVADLRRELNLGTAEDWDDSIADHLAEAVAYLELATGRALIRTRYRESYDYLPPGALVDPVRLHRAPVIAVDRIQYLDHDGQPRTWNADQYTVDLDREPARIALAPDGVLPDVRFGTLCAFWIEYQAGYGTDPDHMPALALEFIRNYVQIRYERRAPTDLETQRQHALLNALTYDL